MITRVNPKPENSSFLILLAYTAH